MFAAVRPLLFRLDPERAHGLTVCALRLGIVPAVRPDDPLLATGSPG